MVKGQLSTHTHTASVTHSTSESKYDLLHSLARSIDLCIHPYICARCTLLSLLALSDTDSPPDEDPPPTVESTLEDDISVRKVI